MSGKIIVLTRRELEVLQLLAKGKLNKEISADLFISLETVKKHNKNIYRKINARNRIEAVHYVIQLFNNEEGTAKIS